MLHWAIASDHCAPAGAAVPQSLMQETTCQPAGPAPTPSQIAHVERSLLTWGEAVHWPECPSFKLSTTAWKTTQHELMLKIDMDPTHLSLRRMQGDVLTLRTPTEGGQESHRWCRVQSRKALQTPLRTTPSRSSVSTVEKGKACVARPYADHERKRMKEPN